MRKPPSLRARALQALALREHSRSELRRKLMRHAVAANGASDGATEGAGEHPPEEVDEDVAAEAAQATVDALLDELQARGLLSEARFTEVRVQARSRRWGNIRIRQELRQHGVELDPETAAELQRSELERARAVWSRKFGQPATEPLERARQARFLAARGFSADVIRQVMAGPEA